MAAYQQLRDMVSQRKETPAVSFRGKIIAQVEKIEASLAAKQAEVGELEERIAQLKQELQLGERMKLTREQLEKLQEKIAQEEQRWQRQRRQLEEELKDVRLWNEKQWEKELGQKRWELEMEEKKRMRILEEKEKLFGQKAADYKQLKEQVKSFPERLEKAAKDGISEGLASAREEFEVEKKSMRQQFESEKQLLNQQIENLENRLQEEKEAKKRLEQQLALASQQIKQLAVAALENKTSKVQETTPKTA